MHHKVALNKRFYLLALFVLCCAWGNAQDCTLDIGGKNKETILKVFQLNEEQIGKMEAWRGELKIKRQQIEDKMKVLLNDHPQETQEDLNKLAKKFDILKEEVLAVSKSYDKKLIAIFNERQYQRYVALCREAIRTPMVVQPE
ncbi:hypothetical protein WIW50_16125 [Flavobacteriaceae bacterium 3-367]|uniref:hypothetical protein n=1 Tax=Eudoraea algarum TaxID=3417568 RepID=UPI0032908658